MTLDGLKNMRLRRELGINSRGMEPLPFGTRSVKYVILGTKQTKFCLKIDHIPGLSLAMGT